MIRVTIEMVPAGSESAKYKMHVIEIWNDLSTTLRDRKKGSYKYQVSRKISESGTVSWHRSGRVENFPRAAKNSVHLLLAVLKNEYEK